MKLCPTLLQLYLRTEGRTDRHDKGKGQIVYLFFADTQEIIIVGII